jgi:hypothetical protein
MKNADYMITFLYTYKTYDHKPFVFLSVDLILGLDKGRQGKQRTD